MKKQILKLFITSVFAVLVTPFVFPATILKSDGAEKIGFGYPFPYIIQKLSVPLKAEYIQYSKINIMSPWENPTTIILGNLLLSLSFYLLLFLAIYYSYIFISTGITSRRRSE